MVKDQGESQMTDTAQRSDPAFSVVSYDRETGTVVLAIKKGIIGPLANQLKSTNNRRKGASIIRKMGHVLSESGDYLYGTSDAPPDCLGA